MNETSLLFLMDEYVDRFNDESLTDQVKERVRSAASREDNRSVFREIAVELWGKYSCVDVDLTITILRRWLAIEPNSQEAKRCLGTYLLAHGPDWDVEGTRLLEEAG